MDTPPKCKITVIDRSVNPKLIDTYMNEKMRTYRPCNRFKDGDIFFITSDFEMPENFCPWAWADIRKDILAISNNASFDWFNQKHMTISGCTDWFRPVLFKIEKISN